MSTVLENPSLRVEINQNGLLTFIEKQSGTIWGPDPWQQSPGDVVLHDNQSKKSIVFDLKNADLAIEEGANNTALLTYSNWRESVGGSSADASLNIRLELAGSEPELRIAIEQIRFDSARFSFQNIFYPKRQGALFSEKDEGYLAIPFGQGSLIPSGRFKRPLRDEWHVWDDLSYQISGLAWGTEGAIANMEVYGWNALSMPWFGAVKNESAFMCVMETDNDAQIQAIMNYDDQDEFKSRGEKSPYARVAVCTPRFQPEMGKFGYARKLIYRFFAQGTHVEMAKYYRNYAEKQGLTVKMAEKIDQFPANKQLLGASLINIDGGYPWYTDYKSMMYTWKDLRRVVDDIHDNLGVKRAMICAWGGYAKLPPDSLPFHPAWGTEQEVHDLVQHVQDMGWLYTTYHGYASNLFHADSFTYDDSTLGATGGLGGRWGGRCAGLYMRYAKRDLPRIKEITGQVADYHDIISAMGLGECYNPDHPHNRTEDRALKIGLFDYVHSLGMITGSEVIQGYITPAVDFLKGGMNVGGRYFLLNHIHAPLYNLVFHDCVVAFDGTVGTSRRKEYSNEMLECMTYGLNPSFSFNMPHYEGARHIIQEHSAIMSDFLAKVALDELTTHAYLADGFDVQQTTFAGGQRVTMNSDTAPFTTDDGLTIPAKGFVVEGDGPAWSASIDTHFIRCNK